MVSIQAFMGTGGLLDLDSVVELRGIAGIDRRAFNPPLASLAAWVIASGTDPSLSNLEGLAIKHFPERVTLGFVRRFADVTPLGDPELLAPTAERDALLEEAFLEAKSDVRKLIVATVSARTFNDDSDFEGNPVYSAANAHLDSIELGLTALDEFDLTRCPSCRTVGEVDTWFGTRVINGNRIPQSWCRICRSTRG